MEIAALRSAVTAVFDLGPNARRFCGCYSRKSTHRRRLIDRSRPTGPPGRGPRPRRSRAKNAKNAPSCAKPPLAWRTERPERAGGRSCAKRCALASPIAVSITTKSPTRSNASKAPCGPGCHGVPPRRERAHRRGCVVGCARKRHYPSRPEATAGTEDLPPPYQLTSEEQASLAGHLALGNARALRDTFGCNRQLLEQAAAGEHLAAKVVARVRQVLGNGVAG